MELGEFIKILEEEQAKRNLSDSRMGIFLGVNPRNLTRWRKGENKPHQREIERILSLLKRASVHDQVVAREFAVEVTYPSIRLGQARAKEFFGPYSTEVEAEGVKVDLEKGEFVNIAWDPPGPKHYRECKVVPVWKLPDGSFLVPQRCLEMAYKSF